jgi:hypothetical protein
LVKTPEEKVVTSELETNALESETGAKKPFMEPEIDSPVDVLETTTFFVSTTSGGLP